PSIRQMQKSLEDVLMLVKSLEKEKRPPAVTEVNGEGAEDNSGTGQMSFNGNVRTRQEALRRLAEGAEYFRQTEPHSPVSYAVQRAIKWGNMSLDAWLEDVVKDISVLGQLRETLGISSENDRSGY